MKEIRTIEENMNLSEDELKKRQDPIHQDPDGKWYFYDETWADRYGPYNTEQIARDACYRYARDVLGL